jgi:hypothetical protein
MLAVQEEGTADDLDSALVKRSESLEEEQEVRDNGVYLIALTHFHQKRAQIFLVM